MKLAFVGQQGSLRALPATRAARTLPVEELKPSQRDATAPMLADVADDLPFVYLS